VDRTRTGQAVSELLRLAIVLLLTAAGYAIGEQVEAAVAFGEPQTTRLFTSVLGALLGYLLGGWVGRTVVSGVDQATRRFEAVPAVQLIAATLGGVAAALVGLVMLLPLLVLPNPQITVPVGVLVAIVLTYLGGRLGATRGAELGRFVGVRGRLDVRTPSRGLGVKVVDSSALIDGRIAELARVGFVEGTLVVPTFVVEEVRRIADTDAGHRRSLGQRGLRTLQVLQDEGLVAVEIDPDPVGGVAAVDDKLAAMCRERRAALLTADAGLARTAEASGIRVLNPHALADAVRSPVLPGDRVEIAVVRVGREPGQGVGYLQDGTMVVVEDAAHAVGDELTVDVTSIVQSRTGRMLFAVASGGGS
jgi:uncharacterized protein YacL